MSVKYILLLILLSIPLKSQAMPREEPGFLSLIKSCFNYKPDEEKELRLLSSPSQLSLFSNSSKEKELFNYQEDLVLFKEIKETKRLYFLENFSFNDLPINVIFSVIDYLDYKDHFLLAQTNRQNLFLWGGITRVPKPFTPELSTSDVNQFNWDRDWPSQATSTMIIEITRDIEEEELEKLRHLKGLEKIHHLHFQATEKATTINIDKLVQQNSFSALFENLTSLVFTNTAPFFSILGSSLQKLRYFTTEGHAAERAIKITRNSEGEIILVPLQGTTFPIGSLISFRPLLQYLSFTNPGFHIGGMRRVLESFVRDTYRSKTKTKTLEIKQESDKDFLFATSDFRLKPWVISDQAIRISACNAHLIPGPSAMTFLTLRFNQQEETISFSQFFSSLFSAGVGIEDLLPILQIRTTQKRIESITRLLRGSSIAREKERIILTLTEPLSPSIIRSIRQEASKKEMNQDTIRVAAFRDSSEDTEVNTEDLITFIKEQSVNNRKMQMLLRELPHLRHSRSRLLSWFQDTIAFSEQYTVEENEDTQNLTNNAEVLLGKPLLNLFLSRK